MGLSGIIPLELHGLWTVAYVGVKREAGMSRYHE